MRKERKRLMRPYKSSSDNIYSSDYIAPDFISGCLDANGKPICQYCNNNHIGILNNSSNNMLPVLQEIERHYASLHDIPVSIQGEDLIATYEIGHNTDIVNMYDSYVWDDVFDWFCKKENIRATFATKFTHAGLLSTGYGDNVTIRISLSPEWIIENFEKGTADLETRLTYLALLITETTWNVAIEFSPIIIYEGYFDDYKDLFRSIDSTIPVPFRENIKLYMNYLSYSVTNYHINHNDSFIEKDVLLNSLQYIDDTYEDNDSRKYMLDIREKSIHTMKRLKERICPWLELICED